MRDNETEPSAFTKGCGVTVLILGIGLVAGVIYVLFMFGSWIGGQ